MSTSYLDQMGMPTLNLPIIASPGGHYVYVYLIVDLFQRVYRQIVDNFAEIDKVVIQEEFQRPYRDEDLQELRNQNSDLITDLCSQYPQSWMHGKITQALDDYFDQDIFMVEDNDEQTKDQDTSDARSECSDAASVSSEASTSSDTTVRGDNDETVYNPYDLNSILAANMTEVHDIFS